MLYRFRTSLLATSTKEQSFPQHSATLIVELLEFITRNQHLWQNTQIFSFPSYIFQQIELKRKNFSLKKRTLYPSQVIHHSKSSFHSLPVLQPRTSVDYLLISIKFPRLTSLLPALLLHMKSHTDPTLEFPTQLTGNSTNWVKTKLGGAEVDCLLLVDGSHATYGSWDGNLALHLRFPRLLAVENIPSCRGYPIKRFTVWRARFLQGLGTSPS